MIGDDIKAWTDTLKPGDEVALRSAGYGSPIYSTATVARMTSTQVILSGFARDRRFGRKNGREIGARANYSGSPLIEPMTQKIRDRIEKGALAQWIDKVARHSAVGLSLNVMRAMKAAHDREYAAEIEEARAKARESES